MGRGLDLTAEVVADVNHQPRSARHPDIGPFAAPAVWWQDIDSGRATIVDGSLALDGASRDCGLGTIEKPFTTLAKAAAFARWGSRIYVKDSIYRHLAVQTSLVRERALGRRGDGPQLLGNCLASADLNHFDACAAA
ncbi:MAG: hypothetical protein ACLQNE_05445 [Thermoguttaceae bacterium]